MPKVSVLMPVFNVALYLSEAIDSILCQTYTDFELIILDDCSTDTTAKIIANYDDERICYHKNESNLGISETLNIGILLARGEYLARMDGDDISLPTRLEKQVAILEKYPEIGICGTTYQMFGSESLTVIEPIWHEDIKIEMLFDCCIAHPSVVIRKDVFIKYNLMYSTEAFPAEDYKLWAECLPLTQFHNIPEVLFKYRIHETQISSEKKEFQKQKSENVKFSLLEWLSSDFTEEEKQFFTRNLIYKKVENINDCNYFIKLANKIIFKNRENGNFQHKRLKKRLLDLVQNTLFEYISNNYFNQGYSIKQWKIFHKSKLDSCISLKLSFKIFIKCILEMK